LAEPNIKEKGWFSKANVQNFLHYYIGEKMKFEKFSLMVSNHFENFLYGLEKPMKLNEMRIMKEPNYSLFRQLIRDPNRMGDPFMSILRQNIEVLGIPLNTYNIVYEGFWDLYCKKPSSSELNVRKLEGWINRINLITSCQGQKQPEEGEELNEEGVEGQEEQKEEEQIFEPPQKPNVKAIVRIRIPFKRPDEGIDVEEGS